jgi:hypothetical protein
MDNSCIHASKITQFLENLRSASIDDLCSWQYVLVQIWNRAGVFPNFRAFARHWDLPTP